MPFRKRLARFNKHVTNRPVNVETRGKTIAHRNPQRFSDPSRGRVPRPVRGILGLLHVEDFLALERA